ncbi:MAG: ROK family glucokinase [Oscillospiraceae bacterium]|nr:ROK family glucokinase [Oscillospiraceae bacterium]
MENRYRIGIDLGGTNIAVGLVDENWSITARCTLSTRAERPAREIIDDMAKAAETVMAQAQVEKEACLSVGVGSPGTCDEKTGEILYANNLGWRNVPLAQELQKRLGLPVYISNDANCAALGEVKAGAAKGCRNALLFTLGTGVGGGIILDGKIFSGGRSCGAELGHTLLMAEGEPCTCGRRGCIEAYASATALIRDTKREMERTPESLMHAAAEGYGKVNGRVAFDAARQGDPAAKRVVENYLRYLGEAVVDMINIFRPDIFILGGGIANEGAFLLEPVRAFAARYAYGGALNPLPEIVCAALGNDAGIIGAAALEG